MNAKSKEIRGSSNSSKSVITYLLLLLLTIIPVAIFLVIPFIYASTPTGEPVLPAPLSSPIAVRTVPVRIGPIKNSIRYVGTIHSRNEIKVLARVSGKIFKLPIQEGGTAHRGTVLAKIVAPEMDARVVRLQADTVRANEDSKFLCKLAKIDRELLDKKAIGRVQADASSLKCNSSKAALLAAKAGLREFTVMAGNTTESAPFSGIVLKWLMEPGENVMPGRPILTFGDTALEIRVQVHEKDILSGIGIGTPVLLLNDDAQLMRIEVTSVAPLAMKPGRMMEVRIALEDKGELHLRHGMSVDVAFVLEEKLQAITVPVNAVYETKTESGVFLVRENIAYWQKVTPSLREHGRVAIEGDIKSGDQVVLGNLESMKNGAVVYPVAIEGYQQ